MSRKARNKIISTPIWVYIVSICIAIVLLLLSIIPSCCCRDSWWKNLFLNIGYGTIASVVVSFLLDLGNTQRQNQTEKKVFDRLNAELKELCAELPSEMYTAVYETFGYDDTNKYTFEQWTQKLFTKTEIADKKQHQEMEYILAHISLIHKTISQIKKDIKSNYDNSLLDDAYKAKLKKLSGTCKIVLQNATSEKYESCRKLISTDLSEAIVNLFEDLNVDYTRAYNEEEYID